MADSNPIKLCECGCGKPAPLSPYTAVKRGYVASEPRRFIHGHNKARLSHGMHESPEYKAWTEMRGRCTNPRNSRYKTYGKRGIAICAEWNSFTTFYRDLGPRPSPEHSLHRVNNDLGYNKDNCEWTTDDVQMNATTRNTFVSFHGDRLTVAQLAKRAGLKYHTLLSRLLRGAAPENAVFAVRREKSLRQKAKEASLPYGTVYNRIHRDGWSEHRALTTPQKYNRRTDLSKPSKHESE